MDPREDFLLSAVYLLDGFVYWIYPHSLCEINSFQKVLDCPQLLWEMSFVSIEIWLIKIMYNHKRFLPGAIHRTIRLENTWLLEWQKKKTEENIGLRLCSYHMSYTISNICSLIDYITTISSKTYYISRQNSQEWH